MPGDAPARLGREDIANFRPASDVRRMGGVTVTGKAGLTNDKFATVVIRLVGGPADGLVFVVPQRNLPKLVGIPSLGDGEN